MKNYAGTFDAYLVNPDCLPEETGATQRAELGKNPDRYRGDRERFVHNQLRSATTLTIRHSPRELQPSKPLFSEVVAT